MPLLCSALLNACCVIVPAPSHPDLVWCLLCCMCSYARAADLFVTALRVAGNSAVTARSGSAPRVLTLMEVDGADSEYWEATLFNLGHAFRKLK